MPWPSWLSARQKPEDNNDLASLPEKTKRIAQGTWEKPLDTIDWSHYTTTQTVTLCAITSFATLALAGAYKTYLRRIPTVEYLKPTLFRRRSLYGYVTSVGDGDGFRLFHTPGGRLAGWGLLPWRRVDKMDSKALRNKTLSVRIAGVDAPEMAHFGKVAQPYSQEALEWLKSQVLHRYVRAYPYRKDQYERVVCTVFRRRWGFFKSDVGYQMLRRGLATVYEAKFGSEFGSKERQYRDAEAYAKGRKIGMWQEPGLIGKMLGKKKQDVESPREYKDRMASSNKESATQNKTSR